MEATATEGSIIPPAPKNNGNVKIKPPARITRLFARLEVLLRRTKTIDCAVKKIVKTPTIKIDPLQENSGSVETHRIQARATIPIIRPITNARVIITIFDNLKLGLIKQG